MAGTTKETHCIFSMRNIIWFIITLTAISRLSSALTISLDSPGSAGIEEEFSVSYEADSSETFDVKIFVHSSEDTSIQRSEYISEIYDSDWKDSKISTSKVSEESASYETENS